MVRNSFLIFTGFSREVESFLWAQGIQDWKDLQQHLKTDSRFLAKFLSPQTLTSTTLREIEEAERALEEENIRYFWNRLPYAESWRLWGEFSRFIWALDIETTGIGHPNLVTCICVCNTEETRQFTRTKNLESFYDFWDEKSQAILTTYNGARFDLPFLHRSMDWKNPYPHIDLMHVLHKMNIKGGLKGSEAQLGIQRSDDLKDLTGNEAVQLWNHYLETDIRDYLDLLEKYNREDTENLVKIFEIVYERKKNKIFPLQPKLPWGI